MKLEIQSLLHDAVKLLGEELNNSDLAHAQPSIERARDPKFGDFATNIAMVLAKRAGLKPRDMAQRLSEMIGQSPLIDRIEIAGPGFINFYLDSSAHQSVVPRILSDADQFGRSDHGKGQHIQIEYVSANPTGPLHVGHGRGAAYGSVIASLLDAVGYEVHREYYVNDAGRQMDILCVSVWLRYLELCGLELTFPSNGYRGDYIWDIAANLHREHDEAFICETGELVNDLPADEPDGGDKELHIDALIERARQLLGIDAYREVFDAGLNAILDDIRDDLALFKVEYDQWYSERDLNDSGAVTQVIERLSDAGYLYDKDGAQWFESTRFGDEKDRVVVRDNGQTTYFASDIAYHLEKLERGFERVIDIWGADHHGYVPRVKASLEALGENPDRLDVLLVQFANLFRQGEKIPMSTRSGQFVTLRQLRKEVGVDAARYFYVMRKCDQHLDFDLDLAKSKSNENPVYYIQYAHARICSVLQQAQDQQIDIQVNADDLYLDQLTEDHEKALLKSLGRYPEVVQSAAERLEPHQLTQYMTELANGFHTYYNAHKFLVDDEQIRLARIKLSLACRQVLRNGLSLLGISAPEKM